MGVCMKAIRVSLVLATIALASCGSSSSKGIDGVWEGTALNSDQSMNVTFMATLAQASGSTVDVPNFTFNSSAPCFTSSFSETASFSATGHSGGFQTGPFTLSITTMFPQQVNNVLTLTGTRNGDGTISGNWTITGVTGCAGNGTFTLSGIPPI